MKYILYIFLLPMFVFCQTNENRFLPQIMPGNPQAYQFMKYGEIPVGKYTGVVNLSVPIYTISAKGLDVPITLSYHSNGFKVNEEAGSTGLGWTLQGIGSINQIVAGTDDFGPFKRRSLQDFTSDPLFGLPLSAIATGSNFTVEGSVGASVGFGGCQVGSLAASSMQLGGYADSEPDVFKFNMLGYSGSFILDWTNNVFVCLSDKNIIIDCPDSTSPNYTPNTFFITVPEGHRFTFSLKEEGIYLQSSSSSEVVGGSFMAADLRTFGERAFRTYQLTELETNNGDKIKFNYLQTNEIVGYPSIYKQFYFIEPNTNTPVNGQMMQFTQSDLTNTIIVTKQRQSYLNSIEFKNGIIEFSTSDRLDIIGAKKIDQIRIKNNNNSIIKLFDLYYEYFISNSSETNLDVDFNTILSELNVSKTPNELTHRLKLVSINESGQPPYLFEYNNISLPKKSSLATDYWGYYNGVLNNNSIFPNFYNFNIFREKEYLLQFEGNNKSPSLDHCKAAVLSKITYPTGGSSLFTYELNSFDNVQVPPPTQGESKTIHLTTIPDTNYNNQTPILIEGGNTIFKITGLLSTQGCLPQYPEAYSSCYLKVTKFKKELITYIRNNSTMNAHLTSYGLKYVLGADLDFLDGNPSNPTLYNEYKEQINGLDNIYYRKTINVTTDEYINQTLNLSEGIAIFEVSGGCGVYSPTQNNWSQSTFNINYRDYKLLPIGDSYGAGLRIKTILNYSDSNTNSSNLVQRKSFEYEGGKLMGSLIYTKKSTYRDYSLIMHPESGGGCEIQELDAIKFNFNSTTIQPLSTSASGNFVGYDSVSEILVDNDNVLVPIIPANGKIKSFYTNSPDLGGIGDGNTLTNQVTLPAEKSSMDNGLLLQEKIFNDDGLPLKEISNNYQMPISDIWFYGYKFALKSTHLVDPSHCWDGKCQIHQVGGYAIKRRVKPLLINSTEKNYDYDNFITTTKTYNYDSHYQLSSVLETNSNGDLMENIIKYPYDFSSEFPGMLSRNMITPVIENLTKINGNITSLTRVEYKFINTPNPNNYFQNSYVIDKVKYSKSGQNADLEDSVLYHQYDIHSNPTEVSKKDDTHIYYIWGYNGQYPIAKIENATFSQVIQYESNLKALSNSGTEADLIVALNSLRTNLPDAMVTTYTYKPLIGVSTITDPKGMQTSFIYDAFNRLKEGKDHQGKIINEYEYHYRNQN